jgi:ABC-2 type transport system ATP-binding protein
MRFAFEAKGLSKTFRQWWRRNRVLALRNVSLAVEPGTIFGLLGANGAGKTTLIKIALTIARADMGQVQLLGQSPGDRSILKRIGYLPENPRFPAHLTASQVLWLYGSLSGADTKRVRDNSMKWLERLGLMEFRDMRVSKFSKGMNERLAFAQALVHEPEFIFLDEPTDGLDPLGRREVRKICREMADAGKTVFINSHILAEIELICDRIALMKAGEVIEQGTVAELTSTQGAYEVLVPAADGLGEWMQEKRIAFSNTDGHLRIQTQDRASANAVIDALRQKNVEIESVNAKRRTLESVFIDRISE